MPQRLTQPHKGGAAAGHVPDWQRNIKEFRQTKDFDENGIPTRAKVKELGIEDGVG
jgi:aldehyde:ferredoxin oxidoreductase